MSIKEMVIVFCEVAKDLQKDYVESWLQGNVPDTDMALVLFKERRNRNSIYKKLQEKSVKQ